MVKNVVVYCSFDDFCSKDFRFIEEASRFGNLHVILYSDEQIRALTGQPSKFNIDERLYIVQALRYTYIVHAGPDNIKPDTLPEVKGLKPDIWAVHEKHSSPDKAKFCSSNGIEYHILKNEALEGFPIKDPVIDSESERKRVIVTGCYDWLHSGHVRFFEEASGFGDLYVIVGHDENLRLLKGEGHPMFPQDERLYMVKSIKYVKSAMLSTGNGWLDAEPEVIRIKPDIYVINSDSGGKQEKQEFCDKHGIKLVILERNPKEGLQKRESKHFRGF